MGIDASIRRFATLVRKISFVLSTLNGNFRFHPQFQSQFLADNRDVIVYLPPDYDSAPGRRYPVLYFHDGQNVFDAHTSFGGVEWGADETADALTNEGAITPLIMVGIYNTGVSRIHEYTPSSGPHGHSEGRAGWYGKMILEELVPFIDSEYRTLGGPKNTGMAGSSLGGLVTLYIGLSRPDVFGKLAVMSPSVWWDHGVILEIIRDLYPTRREMNRPKIWLDMGTEEGSRPKRTLKDARMLRDLLVKRGWRLEDDMIYIEDEGAGHNESAWASRLPFVFRFLFGNR